MKRRMIIMLIALTITVSAVVIVMSQTRQARPSWEFLEVELSESAGSTPTLNRYGGDGWELVNVVSACKLFRISQYDGSATEKCGYWAYFKRQK